MLLELSQRLFGKLLLPYVETFDGLRDGLRRASMPYSVHEYLCLTVFWAFAAFAASAVGLTIFLALALPQLAYSYTLAVLLSFGIGGLLLVLGYSYPGLKAKGIRGKIDKGLPFAVFYMATTASSGSHPLNIFRMLSLRGGAIGEEASRIFTAVQTLGMDLNTAMQRAASRTPSKTFAELLWGMSSIMTTGGSLEIYLRGKTKAAMSQYRRALNDYAKAITLYTEIYITLIVVGSVFFVILIAIISPLVGGNTLMLQTFIVFFFIPLVSMGFLLLLKSANPTE
ncbi:MAG: type II secretion system F family protein [Candidatus Aenigmarchaeota archaeon]|nr:type II secretion system F family protein [Candidatus Aenigmarchaeota archaeon]